MKGIKILPRMFIMILLILGLIASSGATTAYGSSDISLTRVLKFGVKGSDVKQVQQRLYDLGYLTATPNGYYGKQTESAVKIFQATNGLKAPTGNVASWTIEKLNSDDSLPFTAIKRGGSGNLVLTTQKRLASLGYFNATANGYYGPATTSSIENFQRVNGLKTSSIGDQITLAALYNSGAIAVEVEPPISINRTLQRGLSGEDVKSIQLRLKKLGYFEAYANGNYGAQTEAAIKMFQAVNGLESPTGMVSSWTVEKLNSKSVIAFSTLKKGSTGNAVLILQKRLAALGYLTATPTGYYGNNTVSAVAAFQQFSKLAATGSADRKTTELIYTGYFFVLDSNGRHVKTFDKGLLTSAISYGGQVGGKVNKSNGALIWNGTKYFAYINESNYSSYNSLYNADKRVKATTKGLLFDKNGQIIVDMSKGYSAILAKIEDPTGMMIRSIPSTNSSEYTVRLRVDYGETVEIITILKDFYEIKYFNPKDRKIYNGYMLKKGYVNGVSGKINFLDPFSDSLNNDALGYVSEFYESSGDAGTISSGQDAGGVSYGAYQFASNTGTVLNFVEWLKDKNKSFYDKLYPAYVNDGNVFSSGDTNFNTAWKEIAQSNYHEFYTLQKQYSMAKYYDVTVSMLKKTGVDYSSRLQSFAVRNMIFSISIQHGPTGGFNLINLFSQTTNIKDFINDVYDERSKVEEYFSNNPEAIQQAVKNRFVKERAYILRVYSYENAY